MEELENGQAIVDVAVSMDFEDFKADWKHSGVKKPWKKLIVAIALLAFSSLLAYVISSATRTTYVTDFSDNTVTSFSNSSFWALNYLYSLLPAGFLIMVLSELYKSRPTKLFATYQKIFYIDSPRRYVFTEEFLLCIYDAGPHYRGRLEVDYEHYTKTRESKLSFYLFKPESGAIILPKKCFSAEQIAALHDLLSRKYGEKFKEID